MSAFCGMCKFENDVIIIGNPLLTYSLFAIFTFPHFHIFTFYV